MGPTKEQRKAFAEQLADNEEVMGEQAALAVTCELFGISYEDAEWVSWLVDDEDGEE